MDTPRILSLAGTPHPKALVTGVNPANGTFGFRWLDANGAPVDSGGSAGRFTPQWTLEEGNPESVPVEPTDEVLIAAIENPPVQVPEVPQEVTRRQLFLVLNASGITRAQIRAMLDGNEAALIEFEEALTFQRAHPLIGQLGTAMQLDGDDIDDLFRAAAGL